MLGGTVIAAILYLWWRNSEKGWQRTLAKIALVWILASLGMLCLVGIYSGG